MKREFDFNRNAVAYIDGYKCVNCGTCEDACPVDAISEKQKEICHVCPNCSEMKSQTIDEMRALQQEACTLACPLGISPQGYINLIKAGKKKEAYEVIYEKNPLPAVCGFICHHPCEQVCKRGKLIDEPMHIRGLKRYLGEMFLDEPAKPYSVISDKHVAVIGAGPAGLTAAHWLARKGYPVTVFDQAGEAGGMLIRGIPGFRIDKDAVRKEIAKLEDAGIRFELNTRITYDFVLNELQKKYDKIIVATGLQKPKALPIEGYRSVGIYYAVDLMEKVNSGMKIELKGKGVVIGGGSVAMDVARTALRLGADEVTAMCLESGDTIPAHPWEMQEAFDEGVKLIEAASPVKFESLEDAGHCLTGVTYTKIDNFCLNPFGFDRVGEEITEPADFVIVAVGQKPDKQWADAGFIMAGDAAGGKCSVIDAMASGRMAALKADEELSGRKFEEYEVERTISEGERKYKIYPFIRARKEWPGITTILPEDPEGDFSVCEQVFSDANAELEVQRCLQCGYRFVDTSKCIGCGMCAKLCPAGNVISMKAEEVVK